MVYRGLKFQDGFKFQDNGIIIVGGKITFQVGLNIIDPW